MKYSQIEAHGSMEPTVNERVEDLFKSAENTFHELFAFHVTSILYYSRFCFSSANMSQVPLPFYTCIRFIPVILLLSFFVFL